MVSEIMSLMVLIHVFEISFKKNQYYYINNICITFRNDFLHTKFQRNSNFYLFILIFLHTNFKRIQTFIYLL